MSKPPGGAPHRGSEVRRGRPLAPSQSGSVEECRIAETSPATDLLREGVLAKFVRYARLDTCSNPEGEAVPTTPGQWELARLLAGELRALGLDAVTVDAHGIVTATLPPSAGCAAAPVVGLLAHLDTSWSVGPGAVRPLVHRAYGGGPLVLPSGDVCEPGSAVIGHDIVTSDGSTLLGADDKAGVAEIMEAVCRLLREPEHRHGPVRVAFTTDEETGRGIDHLDLAAFGADVAYTLDGGPAGEVEDENFNACNLRVRLEGRSAHPGWARGRMVNAVHLAALLAMQLPAGERPETTFEREGYYHVDEVRGGVEAVELILLLRDFEAGGLVRRRAFVDGLLRSLEAGYPGCRASAEVVGSYENMKPHLDRRPEVVARALEAVRAAGLTPVQRAIRGGTDGAKLTARGLPTPNLFAGQMNIHSRTEWVSATWMSQAVEVVLNLLELWSAAGA